MYKTGEKGEKASHLSLLLFYVCPVSAFFKVVLNLKVSSTVMVLLKCSMVCTYSNDGYFCVRLPL